MLSLTVFLVPSLPSGGAGCPCLEKGTTALLIVFLWYQKHFSLSVQKSIVVCDSRIPTFATVLLTHTQTHTQKKGAQKGFLGFYGDEMMSLISGASLSKIATISFHTSSASAFPCSPSIIGPGSKYLSSFHVLPCPASPSVAALM